MLIYSYLNRISTLFKDLDLPQLMDHLVPVNPQCQTRASDIVKLIILDILSGRQALVHLEQWAHDIDWPKRIRPGLEPSWFNDDAIARHLDRLYEANLHQVLSSCLVQIDKKEGLSLLALAISRVFQRRASVHHPGTPIQGRRRPETDPPDRSGDLSVVPVCERRPTGVAGWAHPTRVRETAHP